MTQEHALTILQSGKNVFLTGPAGSGKTYLLNKFIEYQEERGYGVGITASTGIAATHLGGTTIHSFTGIGILEYLSPGQLAKLRQRKNLVENFSFLNTLIIDEISMLSAPILELVDNVCQEFKDTAQPFGGLQIVLCGDFFQLPPITRNMAKPQFAYKSPSWKRAGFQVCYLEEQHRQDDPVFLKVLNSIRHSEVTPEIRSIVQSRVGVKHTTDVAPTKLYTHNTDVDAINERSLNWLPGKETRYTMRQKVHDQYDYDAQKALAAAVRNCLAPENLLVKEDAAVMFVKNNFEEGYVNGTLGKVIGLSSSGYPLVRTFDGKDIVAEPQTWQIKGSGTDDHGRELVIAEFTQVPLRLAWAMTVHKSQGMSLDAAIIDLSKAFEAGMGYVALSRVRSLEGLFLEGVNDKAFEVHADVERQDKAFRQASEQISAQQGSLGMEDYA